MILLFLHFQLPQSAVVAQGGESQWDSALHTDMESLVVFLTGEMALAYQETLDNSYIVFVINLLS